MKPPAFSIVFSFFLALVAAASAFPQRAPRSSGHFRNGTTVTPINRHISGGSSSGGGGSNNNSSSSILIGHGSRCRAGHETCKYNAVHGWGRATCATPGRWKVYEWCGASERCEDATGGAVKCVGASKEPDGARKHAASCELGTYRCAVSGDEGWEVCSIQGDWIHAGECGVRQRCQMDTVSPYCI